MLHVQEVAYDMLMIMTAELQCHPVWPHATEDSKESACTVAVTQADNIPLRIGLMVHACMKCRASSLKRLTGGYRIRWVHASASFLM